MKISSINLTSGVNIRTPTGDVALTSNQLRVGTTESIQTAIDNVTLKAGCFGAVKFYSKDPLRYGVIISISKSDVEEYLARGED